MDETRRENAYARAALQMEATGAGTSSSSSDNSDDSTSGDDVSYFIWPVDVFGNEYAGEMTHHVLAGTNIACMYSDVARWALAIADESNELDE